MDGGLLVFGMRATALSVYSRFLDKAGIILVL
jgi:hypothetical protein